MKFLVIIFFAITIYAQDSSSVNSKMYSSEKVIISNKNNSKDKSLIKIVPLRYWQLNINKKENKKVDFSTSIEIKNKKQSFIESNLFFAALGSAIILGGTAAYCKNQSDKNFTKYKLTGNSEFLTKSHNFDLYGGLAIGGLQIDLGYMIYRFLTE